MIKIKKFDISEVEEITLLSVEEAEKSPMNILACDTVWWIKSSLENERDAAIVYKTGHVYEYGDYAYSENSVRPAFRFKKLRAKVGDVVIVNNTWCTAVAKNLVLADKPICKHRFDEKSSTWSTSEIKEFINSKEFASLL